MDGMDSPEMGIWTAMTCWFTPTVLFVLLNIVIGTIAITSKSHVSHSKNTGDEPHPLSRTSSVLNRFRSFNLNLYHNSIEPEQQQQHYAPAMSRTPSFLDRLRSFNLNPYHTNTEAAPPEEKEEEEDHTPAMSRAPSFLQRLRSITRNSFRYRSEETPAETGFETLDEAYMAFSPARQEFERSQSDPSPATRMAPITRDLKRSTSEKAVEVETEAELARRPATVREGSRLQHNDGGEVAEGGEVDARADDFINKFRQQLKLQRLDSILRYKEMLNRGK